ncbi:hypothetical protein SAICODRAFT_25247 [Saitoella complicata NRRL Y-17804]|uniref:ER membrane protein complex subunit 7 beta-sandwich domain-containing protein n=1 Tax=Saitoella complicata (strain BCRC 22490 / CBS 7301 / JCM 7358 / NBRC 10748 / NRRL Y-17804) TaxID=698492 RepID=A0A0E9N8Q3_SAICN|nr:uncharacterized protein SAICODRAFT_25247 [Saitoella complicata NRRL Y-17804]ODQ53152.1 hypothetical protein SAICODRAFT_25247 [Saitoella complicata NRRL Y-17804]GAO46277.1 hypothetical protein G7K_0510-t1 [Saitoella complicata NRRL Y-17804]
MQLSSLLGLLVASAASLASAATVQGRIAANQHLPDIHALPPTTLITLSAAGVSKKTHPGPEGRFEIKNVSEGAYLLEVWANTHIFSPVRIDILSADEAAAIAAKASTDEVTVAPEDIVVHQTFRANSFSNKGAKLPYPLTLRPSSQSSFYIPRESLNFKGLLSNPMLLIMIFMGAMMFVMPKLQEGIDPEELKKFQESGGAGAQIASNPLGALENFSMASFLAGQGGTAQQPKGPAVPIKQGGGKQGGRR